MSRISREALYIQMALLVAQRSTCNRMSVGAVIIRNKRVVATGYNGPKEGEEHCNNIQCNEEQPCTRAVHAEINALKNLQHQRGQSVDIEVYITHQPCRDCANHLLGILGRDLKKIYYIHPYRDNGGLEVIKKYRPDIKVIQINEAGETIHES